MAGEKGGIAGESGSLTCPGDPAGRPAPGVAPGAVIALKRLGCRAPSPKGPGHRPDAGRFLDGQAISERFQRDCLREGNGRKEISR